MARRYLKKKLRRMNNVRRANLYFILAGVIFAALFLIIHYYLADGNLFDMLRGLGSSSGDRGGGAFQMKP